MDQNCVRVENVCVYEYYEKEKQKQREVEKK